MDRKCRPSVLWLSKGLDEGGAETILLELARQPPLRQFDIHAASVLRGRMQLAPDLVAAGVTVHDLGADRTVDPTWIWRLHSLLDRGKFRIVHSHSPLPAAAARILVKSSSSKAVTMATEHSVRRHYHPVTRLLNDLTARLDVKRIAVSKAAAKQGTPFDSRPVEVIYHGLESLDFSASREDVRNRLGLSMDDFVIMVVANLRREKNLALMVEAFAVAAGKVPSLRLVMIGEGPERAMLEALISLRGLRDKVHLLGRVPGARAWLPAADVAALTSRTEGLPVFLVEALDAGLPVVATNVGGISEIVSDGHNGILAASGNCQQLAGAFVRMATNRSSREQMGEAARKKSEGWSICDAAERTASIYYEYLRAGAKVIS